MENYTEQIIFEEIYKEYTESIERDPQKLVVKALTRSIAKFLMKLINNKETFIAPEKFKNPTYSATNPDVRNEEDKKYIVRVYFKTNKEWKFPARDIGNARDIAARCTREGVWVVNHEGTEEFYPVTEIHKAKIIPVSLNTVTLNN